MTGNNLQKEEGGDHRISFLSELYIDILGSLVPGLFVVVLTSIVLCWSTKLLCNSLGGFSQSTSIGLLDDWRDLGFGPYGTSVIALVLSYVLGSLFYRQDPKIPDHRSAKLVWHCAKSKEDRDKLAVQPRSENAEDIFPSDAQFPYYFLYEYLIGRGLNRLADWVPWKGKEESTWRHRTKMFINQLKIRLQFIVPEKCKDIVRNEAHVRLATSLWYATLWLIGASIIGIILVIGGIFASLSKSNLHHFAGVLGFDVLIFSLATLIKLKIEKFIHYLRVREIVYVLETADFAQRNGYELHPEDFRSLKPDNKEK
jgi:hypothetical protein